VAILRYHSVTTDPERHAQTIGMGIVHESAIFRKQMEIVARDFGPVSLDDVTRFLYEGSALPRRAVTVTFDDGYTDNATVAAPILDELGIKATFYVTVGPVDSGVEPWFCRIRRAFGSTRKSLWHDTGASNVRAYELNDAKGKFEAFLAACSRCACLTGVAQQDLVCQIERELGTDAPGPSASLMMTWSQVRDLLDLGHVIGSHTLSHPNLAKVSKEEARRELVDSKSRLEAVLGCRIDHFSFPNPILDPHWDSLTLDLSRTAGYKTAATSTEGTVGRWSNPYCLKRMVVPTDLQEFKWGLERSLAMDF